MVWVVCFLSFPPLAYSFITFTCTKPTTLNYNKQLGRLQQHIPTQTQAHTHIHTHTQMDLSTFSPSRTATLLDKKGKCQLHPYIVAAEMQETRLLR